MNHETPEHDENSTEADKVLNSAKEIIEEAAALISTEHLPGNPMMISLSPSFQVIAATSETIHAKGNLLIATSNEIDALLNAIISACQVSPILPEKAGALISKSLDRLNQLVANQQEHDPDGKFEVNQLVRSIGEVMPKLAEELNPLI